MNVYISILLLIAIASTCHGQFWAKSNEVFYLDDGEPKIGPIGKVYVTTLVTPMGLFKYVDVGNSKITPKK